MSILATVTSIEGDNVILKLKDGQTIRFSVKDFSKPPLQGEEKRIIIAPISETNEETRALSQTIIHELLGGE